MKILLLTGSYPPETGGIAQFMHAFVEGLRRRNVEVEVVTAATDGGYIHRVRSWRNLAEQVFLKRPFDRIVASSWSPFAVGLPLGHPHDSTPFDVFCHGMDLLEPSRSLRYRLLMKRTLTRARLVLGNSKYTAELARQMGAPKGRTVVLPPGIDTTRFRPAARPSDGLTILSAGRLVERKGFDTVIRALPSVLSRFPKVRYVCAGGGPDGGRLRQIAMELGIGENVRFVEDPSDEALIELYQSADVFVMPNRIVESEGSVEGFGIVFLEAAACELPTIGGDSGGVPDAIEDGVTGILVDPMDQETLATIICRLLEHKDLRANMGRAGRERVIRMFGEDRIAERYLEWINPPVVPLFKS